MFGNDLGNCWDYKLIGNVFRFRWRAYETLPEVFHVEKSVVEGYRFIPLTEGQHPSREQVVIVFPQPIIKFLREAARNLVTLNQLKRQSLKFPLGHRLVCFTPWPQRWARQRPPKGWLLLRLVLECSFIGHGESLISWKMVNCGQVGCTSRRVVNTRCFRFGRVSCVSSRYKTGILIERRRRGAVGSFSTLWIEKTDAGSPSNYNKPAFHSLVKHPPWWNIYKIVRNVFSPNSQIQRPPLMFVSRPRE